MQPVLDAADTGFTNNQLEQYRRSIKHRANKLDDIAFQFFDLNFDRISHWLQDDID